VVVAIVGLTWIGASSVPLGSAVVPPTAGMSEGELAGLKVYNSQGCAACHRIHDVGGTTGPDLSRAGFRWSRDDMQKQLVTPKDGRMPAYDGFTPEQMDALLTYLESLK
jgi:mono/diheme cytochrome c family protein